MSPKIRLPLAISSSLLLFSLIGCSPKPPTAEANVLAKFGNQTITLADLDQFLMTHAEANRWAPEGTEHAVWIEEKLRRLGLERLLRQSDAMQSLLTDPETAAQKKLWRIQQLNAVLGEGLMQEVLPTEEAIAARMAAMPTANLREPVLDFQHIFFRIDQGNPDGVRATALEVLDKAKAGEDFPSLARQFSHSANASDGGLIRNVSPSNLDAKTQEVLASLDEGSISELVESRTGLHIFRLIRRVDVSPQPESQRRAIALSGLKQEGFAATMQALILDLKQRIPVNTEEEPWQVGSFSIEAPVRQAFATTANQTVEQVHSRLVDLVLMAQEAQDRGLATAEFEERVSRTFELGLMQRVFNQAYENLETLLPPERVRPYYDAQPTLFEVPEKRRLQLIFVAQGRDAFSTQKMLEAKVAALRDGASFAEMAQSLSSGPRAAEGGDLGFMTASEYSQLAPTLGNAIHKLSAGEVSDPIYCTDRILSKNPLLLKGGFAIVKLIEILPAQSRSFEEAIEDVRASYLMQYRKDLDREVQDTWLKNAGFSVVRVPKPEELVQ